MFKSSKQSWHVPTNATIQLWPKRVSAYSRTARKKQQRTRNNSHSNFVPERCVARVALACGLLK